jgi:eukaryotic-like serine/threonine-protein kinase
VSKQLLVIAGPDRGRLFPLTPGQTLLIGRGTASATNLTDPHVSKVHCRVEWDGDRPVLLDNDSKSGTFVNGVRVSRQELQPGAVLRIGKTQLRLEGSTPGAAAAEQNTVAVTLGGTVPAGPAAGGSLPLTGKTLSHYAVGAEVAKGRSGVVFRAHDTRENQVVALKVLWPEFARNDKEVQRLVRAMKTMRLLRHPNLVTIYGAGRSGAYCWIAMEYVEGDSLARRIERGGLDWRFGLRVAVHVARALEHAHQNAVVHRNITPEGVLLRQADQTAKLGDLVLAKALEGILAEKITQPGEMVGDVRYMAPEQTGGAPVDGRADLYSLGALLYAMLAGRPPFEGQSMLETLMLIREAEPAPLTTLQPAVPAPLAAVVLRLLAKEPAARFQTATELLRELERMAAEQGVGV